MSEIHISMTVTHVDSHGDEITVERSISRNPMNDNAFRRRADIDQHINSFLVSEMIPLLKVFGEA